MTVQFHILLKSERRLPVGCPSTRRRTLRRSSRPFYRGRPSSRWRNFRRKFSAPKYKKASPFGKIKINLAGYGNTLAYFEQVVSQSAFNGRESAVNRVLDGIIYPGWMLAPSTLSKKISC